jgi:protein AroM
MFVRRRVSGEFIKVSAVEPLLVLTIGQAPRDDIAKELRQVLGARPIEVRGALDGLSTDEVTELAPQSAGDTFHTRLADGADVMISKKAVTIRLQEILIERENRPVLVACTGKFTGLPNYPNVLFPSTILEGVVDAVAPAECTLGVLVPLAEQVEPLSRQWHRPNREVVVAAVKPGEDPTEAAAVLAGAEVDLVVLDCFGYETSLLNRVRATTGVPVLSAVRCTAHIASEMLG